MLGADTRFRIARWGIPASFVILFAIGAFSSEAWGVGFLRQGIWALSFVVPTFFLAFPTAVALLTFAGARGPVLIALAGLSAVLGFGWSALGAWEIFSSHSSTASIGLIFLPALQLFIFAGIATVGVTIDGVVSLMRRKATK